MNTKNTISLGIAIIEDSVDTQILYSKIARQAAGMLSIDIEIKCYSTLKEASEVILKEIPDIILIDLKLPDGDGFEIIKKLKNSMEEDHEYYSIVVTGDIKGLEKEFNVYNEYNVNRFFIKPIDIKILNQCFINAMKHMRDHKQSVKFYEMLRRSYHTLDNVLAGIIITDKDGVIEYVNKSFQNISGYSEEEILGQHTRILKSGKHDSVFYEKLWNDISCGNTVREIIINKKKSGEIYYQETTIVPYYNDEGLLQNYIVHAADITSVRYRDLEYEIIVQSLPEIVMLFDSTHVCIKILPEKIFETYPSFKKLIGVNISEADFLEDSLVDTITYGFSLVDSNPIDHTIEITINTNTGLRTFEMVVKRFNNNKYIVIMRDITDTRLVQLYKKFNTQITNLADKNKELLSTYFKEGKNYGRSSKS